MEGLPLLKPPYGHLTAIDLNRGEIVWRVPFGDSPALRAHPALQGVALPPRLGVSGAPGAIVTAGGLVFAGGGDMALNAVDAATGAVVWRGPLRQRRTGTPMTYRTSPPDARQFVVIASGAGEHAELVASLRADGAGRGHAAHRLRQPRTSLIGRSCATPHASHSAAVRARKASVRSSPSVTPERGVQPCAEVRFERRDGHLPVACLIEAVAGKAAAEQAAGAGGTMAQRGRHRVEGIVQPDVRVRPRRLAEQQQGVENARSAPTTSATSVRGSSAPSSPARAR